MIKVTTSRLQSSSGGETTNANVNTSPVISTPYELVAVGTTVTVNIPSSLVLLDSISNLYNPLFTLSKSVGNSGVLKILNIT